MKKKLKIKNKLKELLKTGKEVFLEEAPIVSTINQAIKSVKNNNETKPGQFNWKRFAFRVVIGGLMTAFYLTYGAEAFSDLLEAITTVLSLFS